MDLAGSPTIKDLSGWTIRGHVRRGFDASTFTGFSGQVVDSANGIVEISLTAEQTAALLVDVGYVYDVKLIRKSSCVRLIEGTIKVRPEVTK